PGRRCTSAIEPSLAPGIKELLDLIVDSPRPVQEHQGPDAQQHLTDAEQPVVEPELQQPEQQDRRQQPGSKAQRTAVVGTCRQPVPDPVQITQERIRPAPALYRPRMVVRPESQ